MGVQSCQGPRCIVNVRKGVNRVYQALYRKWRPQTFDEVVGQTHITETLKNQVRTGRLSHAYLVIGTRGTGKTTCARILARAVNCEHPVDGNPCGRCAACRGILDGTILDVVELDAASNNGVDNVRALRDEAVFSPTVAKKRVYIIDEVHMLSLAAFNALLKILEEPPEHLMFILATTELQKVPATILSRCQRHSFKRVDSPVIAAYLEKIAAAESFGLTHEAAELIARLAEGGVRDALSLLDQCSAAETIDVQAVYAAMGLAGKRRIAELLDCVLRHDTAAALKRFSALWMDGKDPASLLGELCGLLRDTLMLRVAPKGAAELLSGGYDGETLRGFAARMTNEELLAALGTIRDAQESMRQSGHPRTAAELCLVSLCDGTLADDTASLRARVSRLEETLREGRSLPARAPAPELAEPPEEEAPAVPAREESEELEEFEVYQEAQPEDALIERAHDEPAPAPVDEPLWAAVRREVFGKLPMDLRFYLDDETKISGREDGEVFRLEAQPGFVYGRFNRPEILDKFAAAIKAATGKDRRVLLFEKKDQPRQARSLDELRGIKEVRFINE